MSKDNHWLFGDTGLFGKNGLFGLKDHSSSPTGKEQKAGLPAKPMTLRDRYEEEISMDRRVGMGFFALAILVFGILQYYGFTSSGFFSPIVSGFAVAIFLVGGGVSFLLVSDKRKLGWDITCECGRYIAKTALWQCGHCDHTNNPERHRWNNRMTAHLFYVCFGCAKPPTAVVCHECEKPIPLGHEPVFRPAKVLPPPKEEPEEIKQLRRELAAQKVRLEHRKEYDRLQDELDTKSRLHELETLARRIKSIKQFQKDALKMVADLEAEGCLEPGEKQQIIEQIKDKMAEAMNVDRRGGQSRYNP